MVGVEVVVSFQGQLAAEEGRIGHVSNGHKYSGSLMEALFTAQRVLEGYPGDFLFPVDLGDLGVPGELDLLIGHGPITHNLGRS